MNKIKHTHPFIPTDGSDSFINCKLERKKYADVLTSIVSSYADGFVLAINNKWGTGKTTFIKMWKQQLKNDGFETLYFNAWENDFQPEVMVALLAELSELRSKNEETFKTVVEKAAKFLTKAAPAVAKGVASKVIGSETISEVVKAATEFTTGEIEAQIQSFTDAKKGILDFRESLKKFVQKVDSLNPVIFFIDELDRCRPNYAVSVLEEVKHLFSVPGIVFVLSIDKEQLGYAVKGVYGSDRIDSDEYLRRFIDLEYKIPEPSKQMWIEYLLEYFDFSSFFNLENRKSQKDFNQDKDRFRTVSIMLFSKEEFTLRKIEKCFARIRLTLRTFFTGQYVFPELIVLMSFLYEELPEVYSKLERNKYDLQGLTDEFDNIFESSLNKYDRRKMHLMYASLLVKYENQISRFNPLGYEKLLVMDASNQPMLNIKSKMEDEQNNLLQSISYYKAQFNTSDVELSHVQERYSLSQNLV